MDKVKKYIIAIIIMIITAMVSLLVVSTLTYLFKWQADKAMVGIIVTYILAGFVGGLCWCQIEKRGYDPKIGIAVEKKLLATLTVSMLFVFLLIMISVLLLGSPFVFSTRFVLIWLLIAASIFGGMCVP